MLRVRVGVLYGLCLLALAACQPTAPSLPSPTGSSTPSATPRPTHTATPTPRPSPTAPAVAACQTPGWGHLSLGFPRSQHRLPSLGRVRVQVLFADFEDAPATRSPQEVLALLSPQAEAFFNSQSYGRFDLELLPHFTWLRLSQPSAYYGETITAYAPHLAFLQEAVDLADAVVDFSQVDAVVLLANPDALAIPFGPTYTGFLDSGLQADGVIIPNGITSGRDLLYWGYLWLNHEMGHSLGLPDLYAYDRQDDIFPHTGGYSVMGNIYGHAPELTAMERWQLGWLDDDQVFCLAGGATQEVLLTPIEQAGGLKALLVPLPEQRLLVVESRRAIGYDEYLPEPGALVYIVDAKLPSGYGPIVVLPQDAEDYALFSATLQRGETLQAEGYWIEVLESAATYDRVRVGPAP